jgi:hypothetical protein
MAIDAKHLYKEETGSFPFYEEELEFSVWRSKGQYVIDISDSEKMQLAGRYDLIRFTRTDPDYLEWLENKVMELTNLNKKL